MIHVQLSRKQRQEFKKSIQSLTERELPFATALTLTTLAKYVQSDEKGAISRVFENPTRFTINSVAMKPAKKRDLKAMVYLRNATTKGTPAERYLSAQVFGGKRKAKPSENILRNRGFLNSSQAWLPGSGIRKNKHGNITQAQVKRILAAIGTDSDATRPNPSGSKIFYADFDGHQGVYQRGPRGTLSRLLVFTEDRIPSYRVRFPFYKIAQKTINRKFSDAADKSIARVISTRR